MSPIGFAIAPTIAAVGEKAEEIFDHALPKQIADSERDTPAHGCQQLDEARP
jgi:hypothetical protein